MSFLKEHEQSLFAYVAMHRVPWKWRHSLEAVQFDWFVAGGTENHLGSSHCLVCASVAHS